MGETRTDLFDADGNRVADAARAVHGVIVELDDSGNVTRELDSWDIDEGPGTMDEGRPVRRGPLREPDEEAGDEEPAVDGEGTVATEGDAAWRARTQQTNEAAAQLQPPHDRDAARGEPTPDS